VSLAWAPDEGGTQMGERGDGERYEPGGIMEALARHERRERTRAHLKRSAKQLAVVALVALAVVLIKACGG